MVRVNLVTVPEAGRFQRRRSLSLPAPRLDWLPTTSSSVTGATGFLVLLLAVFVYFGERRALTEVRTAVTEAQADSTRLHRSFMRVRAMEDAHRQLTGRLDRLTAVVSGQDEWISVFETLSDALPAYTWLETVDRADVAPGQIRIEGATFSAAAVTAYMRELEASGSLTRVELIGITRARRDSLSVQGFTLVATLANYVPVEEVAGEEEE